MMATRLLRMEAPGGNAAFGTAALRGQSAALADEELVREFRTTASSAAFGAIVSRHGPMVFRACLRQLNNAQDAEDTAQAVFLVLARQPDAVPANLGGWLHEVAWRTASAARRARTRQARRERAAGTMKPTAHFPVGDELREELDAALTKLPAPLREVVVLQYLEGHGQQESARLLGCSRVTLAHRAKEALRRLQAILSQRGVMLTPAVLGAFLTQEAQAALPPSAVTALRLSALAGATPLNAHVASLTEGVLVGTAGVRLKAHVAGSALLVLCGCLLLFTRGRAPDVPAAPNAPGCSIFGQSAGNGGNGDVGGGQPGFQISVQYFARRLPNGSIRAVNSFNVLDTTGKFTFLEAFNVKATLTRDTYVGVAPDGTKLVVKVMGAGGGGSQWWLTSSRGNVSGTFIPHLSSSAFIWGDPSLGMQGPPAELPVAAVHGRAAAPLLPTVGQPGTGKKE